MKIHLGILEGGNKQSCRFSRENGGHATYQGCQMVCFQTENPKFG
jgi:hypothetical protein